jgi:hypothetical protein
MLKAALNSWDEPLFEQLLKKISGRGCETLRKTLDIWLG